MRASAITFTMSFPVVLTIVVIPASAILFMNTSRLFATKLDVYTNEFCISTSFFRALPENG
jgi:hypothetical protein